jgi:hypothetical protein
MTYRAGIYVALTGLLTAVLCGVSALTLLATFGSEPNWVFDVRDDASRLAFVGMLGLVALCVGLALAQSAERRPGRVAAACSLGCLGAAALWLLVCLVFVTATAPHSILPGVAVALGARGAAIGVGALAALGSLLGFAALPSGVRGLAAFCINVLVLAAAGVALFVQVGALP